MNFARPAKAMWRTAARTFALAQALERFSTRRHDSQPRALVHARRGVGVQEPAGRVGTTRQAAGENACAALAALVVPLTLRRDRVAHRRPKI